MNYNTSVGYGLIESIRAQLSVPALGKVLIVCPSADANYDRLSQIFRDDPDGSVRLFTTVASAYDAATTDANDVIVLSGNASHTLTAMLTVSKNRVHFIGFDGSGERRYGQGAKITIGVTTNTANVAMIKNTGVRNTFTNIKFTSNDTLTQAITCFAEGGEYTTFKNCEFYKSTHLTSDTAAELLLNGDSTQFYNCTFGSLADSVTGDKIRPAVRTANGQVAAGLVCRDVLFEGCRFWKKAGGTTTAFVYVAADADIERGMEFSNCRFIANKLGSVPAVAIATAASLTNSQIMLTGDTIAVNCTKVATATGVVNGTPARVATATIAIQAT